jgi:8-oxo-dGTP diphosphatase
MTRENIALGLLQTPEAVLLVKEAYGGYFWTLPGGVVEAGETFVEAVVREVHEETGLTAQVSNLVVIKDRPSQLCVVFTVEVLGGTLLASVPGEIEAIEWFELANITATYPQMDDFTRTVVQRLLQDKLNTLKPKTYIGRNGQADLFD